MGIVTKDSFPPNLKLMLENDNIVCTGRKVQGDCDRLRKLVIYIKSSIDLRKISFKHDQSTLLKGGTSLSNLCKIYLKTPTVRLCHG